MVTLMAFFAMGPSGHIVKVCGLTEKQVVNDGTEIRLEDRKGLAEKLDAFQRTEERLHLESDVDPALFGRDADL